MNNRTTENVEPLDQKTSRAICEAVGERIGRDIQAEYASLSPHLQRLVVELRVQDSAPDPL